MQDLQGVNSKILLSGDWSIEGCSDRVVGGGAVDVGVAMLYCVGLCCLLVVALSFAFEGVAVACCLCRCHRLLRCVL